MSIIKTLIAIFATLFAMAGSSITATLPGEVGEAKSAEELEEMTDIFDNKPLSNTVVVLRTNTLSKDERSMMICLQGLANKEKAQLFLDFSTSSTSAELAAIASRGCILSYTDANGKSWSMSTVIAHFADCITDNSYTLYTDADTHGQINTAFNMATVYGRLAVPASCEETVKQLGMTKGEDLTDDNINYVYEREFYEEHKDYFRKDALVHMYASAYGLRDLAIQQNIFIAYTQDSSFLEKTFRHQLLTDLEPASIVMGWCQYEIKFTKSVSSYGHYVIPSDHSYNVSILGSCDVEPESLCEPVEEAPELDPTKHYIAIMYSDGDNVQWVQNGYSEFHTWQSYGLDTPVSWTFPPLMSEFSSADTLRTVANLGSSSLICGSGGAGYARISQMSADKVDAYSHVTAAAMLRTGMTTLTIIDGAESEKEFESIAAKLAYFSRYDNINGGILQLDPDRYAAGKGRVFFCDDKPFVSVGLTLWHPSGDPEQVTQEWLKEQADIVNGYPADITTINGYTVINVHPWTVGPDDLAYFVSQLDDGVEVISADELIAALDANIPHSNAEKNTTV